MQILDSSYIDLPCPIKLKEAYIKLKNNDNVCFISALYPATVNSERKSSYPHYSTVVTMKNIVFPMTLKQISLFQKQNQISVNVQILKKKINKRVYNVSSRCISQGNVNLLLQHYVNKKGGADHLTNKCRDGKCYLIRNCAETLS